MTFINPYPGQCCFHWEKINSNNHGIHPLELHIAKNFRSDVRKAEFISGRRCAQIAMKEAGVYGFPVIRNQDRSPGWPFSIKGSISHGAGIASALVSKHHSRILGIGLDVEDLSREIKVISPAGFLRTGKRTNG